MEIYANKSAVERAGICHRKSVDSWLKQGKLQEVFIVWGSKDGKAMYSLPIHKPRKNG